MLYVHLIIDKDARGNVHVRVYKNDDRNKAIQFFQGLVAGHETMKNMSITTGFQGAGEAEFRDGSRLELVLDHETEK